MNRNSILAITALAAVLVLWSLSGNEIRAIKPDAPVSTRNGKSVIIGTGGVSGVYFPAGGAICRLVNKGRKSHGIRCAVESTGGSVDNLNAMRANDLDFGIAQSDWQYHAVNGTGRFADAGPFTDLRSVFSVHGEAFTVLARRASGIIAIADLKGKRVGIGRSGSGQRAMMALVMEALGWQKKDLARAFEFAASEQHRALCSDKTDAVVYVVGHPNGVINEALGACETVLVEVAGAAIDGLVKERPYFAHAVIPGGMYKGNAKDVKTFGVTATLVVSAKLDAEIVYEIVKAVFDNFDEFKGLHPAFAHLERKNLARAGNSAPLHDGAVRYFKENSML
jgi:TRAP transporter TAXI family solute receptor